MAVAPSTGAKPQSTTFAKPTPVCRSTWARDANALPGTESVAFPEPSLLTEVPCSTPADSTTPRSAPNAVLKVGRRRLRSAHVEATVALGRRGVRRRAGGFAAPGQQQRQRVHAELWHQPMAGGGNVQWELPPAGSSAGGTSSSASPRKSRISLRRAWASERPSSISRRANSPSNNK